MSLIIHISTRFSSAQISTSSLAPTSTMTLINNRLAPYHEDATLNPTVHTATMIRSPVAAPHPLSTTANRIRRCVAANLTRKRCNEEAKAVHRLRTIRSSPILLRPAPECIYFTEFYCLLNSNNN